MAAIGRNDPCLCGSGRKYKHCCLLKLNDEQSRRSEQEMAVAKALRWLVENYRDEVELAFDEDYYSDLDQEARLRLEDLPGGLPEMVETNAAEWLLAEAELEVTEGAEEVRRRAADLVLATGGPLLTARQRQYLQHLSNRPLRLYEVRESRPGEGLRLKDLLEESKPPIWVRERSGSGPLVLWDVVGARAIPVEDHWELSGAVYPFDPGAGAQALERIKSVLSGVDSTEAGAEPVRSLISGLIIDSWLDELTAPRPAPQLVDAGTGDPLMLVTDHYEVLDWDRLAKALESQPDVEGDRREGWTRYVELDDETRRSLLAINLGKKRNRIEPFARTLRLAEEGKAWLEQVAGDAIRFLTREMTDPRNILTGSGGRGATPHPKDRVPLPPEQQTRLMQEFHERHYRKWADEPIPALGSLTPRDALRTEEGRAKVIQLLKRYESGEIRRAREEGRQPVDFAFLWKQVGLDPEAVLSS